jgi:hypothetical protein
MTPRHRRLVLLSALILIVAACGPGGGSGQSGSTAANGNPAVSPSALGDGSSGVSGQPGASSSVGQTDTAWGRIWDAVPAGFPRFPDSSPADDASAAPSSARYAVSGNDPEAIAAWLQAGMETAKFSTDVSGPLEDGTFTIDSRGDGGCRIQTTITPLGGMTFVTVLYGADCPIR